MRRHTHRPRPFLRPLTRLRAALAGGLDLALFLILAPVVLILARRDKEALPPSPRDLRQSPLEGAGHRA